MAWLYVPVLEASNLGLNQELMDSKPFVMSRGKPMQLRSLSRKYKKEKYMKRLFGLTLKPSTANVGVEKWISSLEDSPVSPIQVLGSYLEKTTQETYGRTLKESLARFNPASYSWRTFQTSITPSHQQLLENWPKWGLTRRGVLYALPTLERPIDVQGGSSWPTPTVNQVTRNYDEPIEKYLQRIEDYKQGKTKGKPGVSLGVKVRMMLPTPTANEAQKAGLYKKGQMGNSLVAKAKRGELFPTPTAREPNDVGLNLDRGRYSNDTLTRKVSNQEGLKNGGRLNPEWVEWLMGWPIGWTDSED